MALIAQKLNSHKSDNGEQLFYRDTITKNHILAWTKHGPN